MGLSPLQYSHQPLELHVSAGCNSPSPVCRNRLLSAIPGNRPPPQSLCSTQYLCRCAVHSGQVKGMCGQHLSLRSDRMNPPPTHLCGSFSFVGRTVGRLICDPVEPSTSFIRVCSPMSWLSTRMPFLISWSFFLLICTLRLPCFPKFSKIRANNGRFILVAPNCPSQRWFLEFLSPGGHPACLPGLGRRSVSVVRQSTSPVSETLPTTQVTALEISIHKKVFLHQLLHASSKVMLWAPEISTSCTGVVGLVVQEGTSLSCLPIFSIRVISE